jgi:hypothetical protein
MGDGSSEVIGDDRWQRREFACLRLRSAIPAPALL